ncbi:hypothetical protein SEEERB17_001738 [Salmonella enterica subsp. enterica serovar Enteritidis str. SARB17]|nr:hypothetical protein SEEERB17_001738 [Salmonella enterica subsp. enterica serovar Enteritidis str. SARB17]
MAEYFSFCVVIGSGFHSEFIFTLIFVQQPTGFIKCLSVDCIIKRHLRSDNFRVPENDRIQSRKADVAPSPNSIGFIADRGNITRIVVYAATAVTLLTEQVLK